MKSASYRKIEITDLYTISGLAVKVYLIFSSILLNI